MLFQVKNDISQHVTIIERASLNILDPNNEPPDRVHGSRQRESRDVLTLMEEEGTPGDTNIIQRQ